MPFHITIIYSVCALVMSLVGIVVLVKDWRSWINRSFFIFVVSIILWMWFLYFGYANVPDRLDQAVIFFRWAFGASVFLPYSLALFFYFFPKQSFHFPKYVTYPFALLTFVLALLATFTPMVEESAYMDGEIQKDVFGSIYNYYLLYCLSVFLFAVVCTVKNLIQSKGRDRSKLIYVSLGFFLFIFASMMTNVILPAFGIFVLQAETVTFSLFFIFAAFYSIYKQRFFNLSFLALQFFREFILFMLGLISLLSSYELLSGYIPERYTLSIISTLFAYIVYKFFSSRIPLFYSQSFSHLRKMLRVMEGTIFACKTYGELQDLLASTFVEKLSFSHCALYSISNEQMTLDVPTYPDDELAAFFRKHKSVLIEELKNGTLHIHQDLKLAKKLQDLHANVVFGLYFQNTLIGILVLGKKLDRRMVSAEELQTMISSMSDVGLALMNIIVNENLREENDVMKQIINEKTQILRKNNAKLQEMIKQQDSFISLTAHEFRTPLTVAMLGMEQIPKIHKDKIPHDVVSDVETSYRQLNRLTHIINRLLEMRRLEDNKIPVVRERFELVGFVKSLVHNMKLLASKSDVKLDLDLGLLKRLPVYTDQMKIQEVIENLLQNALKFSKKDDVIKIVVSTDKQKKFVSISVIDQGPGVPKKDQKVIFEKFRQGSRYSRGVGIGLYLCKHYMKLLNGEISLKSVEGKGATFTIHFPTGL